MKKVISVLITAVMLLSSVCGYALDTESAYNEFKTVHPEFINSLINGGIPEETIIAFINDVYDYLMEIDAYTPVTRDNFEKNAIQAITDVSSREAYYSLQDALLILYPDAIKLAVTQGTVADEFKPLVETIKGILFPEEESGSSGSSSSGSSGSSGNNGSSGESTNSESNSSASGESNDTIPVLPDSSEETFISSFSDVAQSHWAYTPISYLADNFILNGYLDGSFKPESSITRAEFAKIIVSATDSFAADAASSFSDVSSDSWYYLYVSAAYKLGYITGYPDGSFRPDDKITRADICTIVNRVLKAAPDGSVSAFIDDWSIPSYAKDSVYALAAKGIVNGYADGTFSPTSYATRAQTAKIIYSAFFSSH